MNGRVKITLDVDAGTGPDGPLTGGSDAVGLRRAPVIFRHHLDEAITIDASKGHVDETLSQAAQVSINNVLSGADVMRDERERLAGRQDRRAPGRRSPELAGELDALAARLAKSPIR